MVTPGPISRRNVWRYWKSFRLAKCWHSEKRLLVDTSIFNGAQPFGLCGSLCESVLHDGLYWLGCHPAGAVGRVENLQPIGPCVCGVGDAPMDPGTDRESIQWRVGGLILCPRPLDYTKDMHLGALWNGDVFCFRSLDLSRDFYSHKAEKFQGGFYFGFLRCRLGIELHKGCNPDDPAVLVMGTCQYALGSKKANSRNLYPVDSFSCNLFNAYTSISPSFRKRFQNDVGLFAGPF